MKKSWMRHAVQAAFTVVTNGYLTGYLTGTIYQGNLKQVCLPGLNCYSCPGAFGSCPIGSLQAALGSSGGGIPFYVLGTLLIFGVALGRLVCGFLCPFGFIQDLLHKIKVPKIKIPVKIDRVLRYLKYVILLSFVITLPMFLTDQFGLGQPYFCKYICPAGMVEGAIPLLSTSESLTSLVGALFYTKLAIMAVILLLSVFTYRSFCKYICPLGAIYALFNKVSLYKLNINEHACTRCGKCNKTCKMNVDVLKDINSPECIRCGDCKRGCPTNAISSGFRVKAQENKVSENVKKGA